MTIKILLTLAAQKLWPFIHLDVNNAFLNGDVEEEVYMHLLQGYTLLVTHSNKHRMVCKLQKSLYGLRQASHQWYSKISSFFYFSSLYSVQSRLFSFL